jgi:hypothetical protein
MLQCCLPDEMTIELFQLVDDACLKELGFKMGSRLKLLKWIREKSNSEPGLSPSPTPSNSGHSSVVETDVPRQRDTTLPVVESFFNFL